MSEGKAAVLVVSDGKKSSGVIERLEQEGNIVYECKMPRSKRDMAGFATLRAHLERSHPDMIVMATEREKGLATEALAHIKNLTLWDHPTSVSTISNEGLGASLRKDHLKSAVVSNAVDPTEVCEAVNIELAQRIDYAMPPHSMRHTTPKVYVVAGVTSSGKTTLVDRAVPLCDHARIGIKHRSGKLRKGNVAGLDYIVRQEAAIQADIRSGKLGDYLHYGRTYGIPFEGMDKTLARGEDAILIVAEVDAVKKVIDRFGRDKVRTVYLYTTAEALETRLAKDLAARSSSEIRKRMKKIREEELPQFLENMDLFDYFLPNFNPPYPEDSSDFRAKREEYWDDREIQRSVSWLNTVLEWEYDNESLGSDQADFERDYTNHLVESMFGLNIDELISSVHDGKKVKLRDDKVKSYVDLIREKYHQKVDLDGVRRIIDRNVIYVHEGGTLSLFFDQNLDSDSHGSEWTDKMILMEYANYLVDAPEVHVKTTIGSMQGYSAFGGCYLETNSQPVRVDDGLFYALSLPPEAANQRGASRRLALSFLADDDIRRNIITSRDCTDFEKGKFRQQHQQEMQMSGMHNY